MAESLKSDINYGNELPHLLLVTQASMYAQSGGINRTFTNNLKN